MRAGPSWRADWAVPASTELDTVFTCAQVAPTGGFEVSTSVVAFMIPSVSTGGERLRCTP